MDDDIFTHYSSSSEDECWVGYDFGVDMIVEISEVQFILKEGVDAIAYR